MPPKSKPAKKPAPAKQPTGSTAASADRKATIAAVAKATAAAKVAAMKTATVAKAAAVAALPIAAGTRELLGEVSAPSGTLVLFDVGLLGFMPREALEPAMVRVEVPADRKLRITGVRVGSGRYAACWNHVAIELDREPADDELTHAKKLGEIGVDFARIMIMDPAALDHWVHDTSLDGKADFVFWGRDAITMARTMTARPVSDPKDAFGWVDVLVQVADERADKAARLKASNRWLLAMELRPHSHHYLALAAARNDPNGVGTIAVAGHAACLVSTSWGDGVYPVFVDLDHDDRPRRIRIQLADRATV